MSFRPTLRGKRRGWFLIAKKAANPRVLSSGDDSSTVYERMTFSREILSEIGAMHRIKKTGLSMHPSFRLVTRLVYSSSLSGQSSPRMRLNVSANSGMSNSLLQNHAFSFGTYWSKEDGWIAQKRLTGAFFLGGVNIKQSWNLDAVAVNSNLNSTLEFSNIQVNQE